MRLPSKNIRTILVISLSNVGDCLLTLPVFSALRSHFPDATLSALVGGRGKEVFQNDPRLQELFVYDKKAPWVQKIRLVLDLRRRHFDLAVDLRNSFFPILIGARNRTPLFHTPSALHRFDRHLERLIPLGLSPKGQSPEDLWISPEARKRMERLLEIKGISSKAPFAVVSPGSRSDLKRWGEKSYALLCERLIREKGLPIVFVGELFDRKTVDAVTSYSKEKTASLVGETSVEELAALLERARLLVTNDSAALHAATLVGCPTVALFGPTDPKKYGPKGEKKAVVRKELFCSPCERAQCPYHHECMEEMSVEEVYQACSRILGSS